MKRYGRNTAQGVWQPPDLCAMVTAWFRRCRNSISPIRSRADQTTQAIRDALSRVAAEFSGCVSSRRRSKLRIVCFRIHAKAHSLRCSSSPNRTRCAGLRFGFGTGDRVLPHTAFVLTWFKIKKRQASATWALRILKCFCGKGFRHCSLSELLRFLRKSSGNGQMCQGVNCAYLN